MVPPGFTNRIQAIINASVSSFANQIMQIGYHSNGMTQHGLFDGLNLLAQCGYKSVAINIDHGWLAPHDEGVKSSVQSVCSVLTERKMSCVVEAGANFLLDPSQKNFPTLMEHDPGLIESRMRYLKYCVDVAAELNADCMSMRSGNKPEGLTFEQAMGRLVDGIEELLLYAAERDVVVSIEPEPGMLVDTLGRFERLLHLFDSPRLMLTLDITHIFVNGELPLAAQLDRWKEKIATIHVSDVRAGDHNHLPFGGGQIGFPLVMDAIAACEYEGGIHVDLPDFSHIAVAMIQSSHDFLVPLIEEAKAKYLEQ